MPIYQYNCQACGHQLEVLQKVSEEPLTDCPECGKTTLKKGVTAAAFRLKGTGWYETDFKNKSKDAKGAEGKSKSETESVASKPEADKSGKGAQDKGSGKSKTSGTAASDA